MDIKEFYNGIAKKENLQSFEEFDLEFEISEIKENFSKKISQKIVEKIDKYQKMLEEFLQPDGTSLAALVEVKNMKEADSDKINTCFKECVLMHRKFIIADLENSDKLFIEFMISSVHKWKELKPLLKDIFRKAHESWKYDIKIKDELGYLG